MLTLYYSFAKKEKSNFGISLMSSLLFSPLQSCKLSTFRLVVVVRYCFYTIVKKKKYNLKPVQIYLN